MLLEWKKVLTNTPWYTEATTETELAQAERRLDVRLAAECLLAGDSSQGVGYLEAALQGENLPFDSLDGIIRYLSRYPGLNGRSLTPELLANQFRSLKPSSLSPTIRRLRAYALANDLVERAFQHRAEKNYPALRRSLAAALAYNPRWLNNRAVVWIGLESLAGEKLVGLVRRALAGLRLRPQNQDATR